MNISLLDSLTEEIETFTHAGETSLNYLLEESQDFLNELRNMRSQIEKEYTFNNDTNNDINNDADNDTNNDSNNASNNDSTILDTDYLQDKLDKWYKKSIIQLKTYNSATNKFQKNILTNSNYNVDLDEAYTFPLNLDNFAEPLNKRASSLANVELEQLREIRHENEVELMKAIISHLLKIGQCDIVNELIESLDENISVDPMLLSNFKTLNEIVDDIILKHDLQKSLEWMRSKHHNHLMNNDVKQVNNIDKISDGIEFKFHVLQFILLLHGDQQFTPDNALNAYLYAKENFPRFFKHYIDEISSIMTLLLFQPSKDPNDQSEPVLISRVSELIARMKDIFEGENDGKKSEHGEILFISEILSNFENIHKHNPIFENIANDFISEYCKDLKLSNDSSLFQSILAGYLNLPSFYKYNKIQLKLNKVKSNENTTIPNPSFSDAPYDYDIPFQLPDSNRFLFNYHPIFICPITKEQLVPLFSPENLDNNDPRYKRKPVHERQIVHNNPVVVLNFCQHLALKESVWQLSKKGTDIFKCHYCYKKHKFSDVTEAYFIDL